MPSEAGVSVISLTYQRRTGSVLLDHEAMSKSQAYRRRTELARAAAVRRLAA